MVIALALGVATTSLPFAAATPGDVDLAFGGGDGKVGFDVGVLTQDLQPRDIAVQADGRSLVHGHFGPERQNAGVVRYTADGAIDDSWNGGRPVPLPDPLEAHSGSHPTLSLDGAGRLLARTGSSLRRYTTAGAPDPTFSGDGALDLSSFRGLTASVTEVEAMVALGGGKTLVAVAEVDPPTERSWVILIRLNGDGTPDATFSADGAVRVFVPDPVNRRLTIYLQVDGGGNAFFVADPNSRTRSHIGKVSPTGVPLVAFGGDGLANGPLVPMALLIDPANRPVLLMTTSGQSSLARFNGTTGAPDTTLDPDGSVPISIWTERLTSVVSDGDTAYVAVTGGYAVAASAIHLDGTPVVGFGDGDPVYTPPWPGAVTGGAAIARLPDGRLRLAVGFEATSPPPSKLLGLTAAGQLDPGYSSDGQSDLIVTNHASAEVTATAVSSGGSLLVAGTVDGALGGAFVARASADGIATAGFSSDGIQTFPDMSAPTAVAGLPGDRTAVVTADQLTVLTAAGEPDPSFGTDGSASLGLGNRGMSVDVAGDAAILVGTSYNGWLTIRRFDLQTGTLDSAYGAADGDDDAQARVPGISFGDFRAGLVLDAQPDGSVLWATGRQGSGSDVGDGMYTGVLTSSGAPDPTFSGDGVLPLPSAGRIFNTGHDRVQAIRGLPGGGAEVLAARVYHDQQTPLAVRITADGVLDPSFSSDGLATITPVSGLSIESSDVEGGRATFVGQVNGSLRLVRFTASGAPDTSIGTGGYRSTTYPVATAVPVRALVQSDGVVLGTSLPLGPSLGADPLMVKLTTLGPMPPGAPTTVQAVAGPGAATVSWTPPANVGGTPITAYTVTSSPHGRTCTAAAPAASCRVEQLTNSISYTFTVVATNAAGTSPASASSSPVTPWYGYLPAYPSRRLADSRPTGFTGDGTHRGFGRLTPGSLVEIQVRGRFSVPNDAATAVLNVAAVDPTGGGHLTVYPCGSPPATSSLNFTRGVTLANLAVTKLSPGGSVCLTASTPTDVIVDLAGTFTGPAMASLPTPKRIADSRPGSTTDDGNHAGFGRLAGGTFRTIPVAGRVGLAPGARSAVLNIAAVNPSAEGFVTVYPCGTRPTSSTFNFTAGVTIASSVPTKLSASGAVCVYASRATDIVVDVSGSIAAANFLPLPTPKRVVDSRPTGHTADGQLQGFGQLAAGSIQVLPIAGRVGLPAIGPISGGGTLVLTITAVRPGRDGYFTVYSCGASGVPGTSTLNYRKGVTVATTTIALSSINPVGRVCVYTSAPSDLVIDAIGSVG